MEKRVVLLEQMRRKATRDLLSFMRWVWWMPDKFVVGRHTVAICDRLTRAVDDFLAGKSTRILIDVPFRHGKSDIVSRALPAYFLGRCASGQHDVLLASYAASLAEELSGKVKDIIKSDAYRALFPFVELSEDKNAINSWKIKGSAGMCNFVGVCGGATGKGASLEIIDDPFKDEQESASPTIRNTVWQQFRSSFCSRLAPCHIQIVMNTRWHIDDLTGRIMKEMKESEAFPRFEHLSFPSRKSGVDGWDYLFLERFSRDWYNEQRAVLGSAMASAMLDCCPVSDASRWFGDEMLEYYTAKPNVANMNIYIFADTAGDEKNEQNDYTVFWVVGLGRDGCYYVLDGIRDKLSLSERTDHLFDLVATYEPKMVFFEKVGAMTDIGHIKLEMDARGYRFAITAIKQTDNKFRRMRSRLQPLFESRKIILPLHLLKVDYQGKHYDMIYKFVEEEYKMAPSLAHDDMLDCLANIEADVPRSMMRFPKIDKGRHALSRSSGASYSASRRASLFG